MPDDGQQGQGQGDRDGQGQQQQGDGQQQGRAQGQQAQQGNDGIDPAILAGAQNPDAVRNAIKAEREAAARAKQEAEAAKAEAQKLKDAQLSDQERKDKEAKEATARATAAETKALKYEVAAAKGVPLSQAHRLQGATKDELEADADAFLKDVKGGNGTSMDGGAAGRDASGGGGSFDDMIRARAGRA